MIVTNAIVSIYQLTGTVDEKSYSLQYSDVRALVLEASPDILMLHPDLPVGKTYSIMIRSNTFDKIYPDSKIVITTSEDDLFNDNDTFYIKEGVRKSKIMGNFIFEGLMVQE